MQRFWNNSGRFEITAADCFVYIFDDLPRTGNALLITGRDAVADAKRKTCNFKRTKDVLRLFANGEPFNA